MSMRLWTTDEDSIDLGNTFEVLSEFKKLAKAIGDRDGEFAELLAVTQTNDDTLPAEYVTAIAAQATKALDEFGDTLGGGGRRLLKAIAGMAAEPDGVARALAEIAVKAFCPTGAGGGIDNTCGGESGGTAAGVFSLPDRPLSTPAATGGDLPADVGGHRVVFNQHMNNEGRADPDGTIQVGPKFLELGLDQQNHVLLHEWVHHTDLEMVALQDSEFWDKLQSGGLWGEPDENNVVWGPGGNKPNENIVESIISFVSEPEWLRGKYPGAYDYVESLLATQRESKAATTKAKAFCPTGPGGGVDNSCSPNEGGGD